MCPLLVDPVQDNPYDNDYGRGIEDALELPVVFVTPTMASSSSVLTNMAAVSASNCGPCARMKNREKMQQWMLPDFGTWILKTAFQKYNQHFLLSTWKTLTPFASC